MNKKLIIVIIAIIVVVIILGGSYAYLRVENKGSEQNIGLGNFGVIIKEDMQPVTLSNEVPKSDEEGLKNTPNTFVIKNTGNVTARYELSLIDSTVASTVSNLDIRYRVIRTRSTTNSKETLEIKSLELDGLFDKGTIEPDEEISYELTLWINYNSNPNGLTYSKILSLEGMQADSLDTSGANPPEMLSNMIPVYYEKTSDTEGVWKKADVTNRDNSHKWYDYNDYMWANAVTVKESNGILDENRDMKFDGVDDYYSLGYQNYDFKNNISLVARFKLESIPSSSNGCMMGNQESAGFYLMVTTKAQVVIGLHMNGKYNNLYSLNTIDVGKWYTVVAIYDNSKMQLYIYQDGSLVSKDELELTGVIKPSVAPMMLGANPTSLGIGNQEYLNCTIDSAFVYTDTLTDNEITKYFTKEITDYPKDNLLVAKIEFNENDTRQKYLEGKSGTEVKMEDITSMWVWIPRYKYTIFNGNNETATEQMIDVSFEYGIEKTGTVSCHDEIKTDDNSDSSEVCEDKTNGSIKNGISTYTHPAFTFGDEELVGFWFSKFDAVTDDKECLENQSTKCDKIGMNILIKPNQVSLRYQGINNLFTNIRNMETAKNIHGFPQNAKATMVTNNSNFTGAITNDNNNYDTHMVKNMEWGAVAYLSMSKYGKYGNSLYKGDYKEVYSNNYQQIDNEIYTRKTGYSAGMGSQAFGTSEYLYNNMTIGSNGQGYLGAGASTTGTIYGVYDMSGGLSDFVMANMVNTSGEFYSVGWSSSIPLSKYYDKYSFNVSNGLETSLKRGKLGDATREVQKDYKSQRWFKDRALLFHDDKNGKKGVWLGRGADAGNADGEFQSTQWYGGGTGYIGSRPVLAISRDFPWKK